MTSSPSREGRGDVPADVIGGLDDAPPIARGETPASQARSCGERRKNGQRGGLSFLPGDKADLPVLVARYLQESPGNGRAGSEKFT